MANRFPLVINNSSTVVGELQEGDTLNLSLSGIYDGASTGLSGQVLKATGSGNVTWGTVGDVFLTTTQTLQNKTLTNCILNGLTNSVTNIPNGSLVNSSITINGTTVALGGSVTTPDNNATYSIGTTTVSSNQAAIKLTGTSGGSSTEFNLITENKIYLTRSTNGDLTLGTQLSSLTPGSYITGNAYNGLTAETWTINATPSGTNNGTIVARGTNGDFTAGNISATSFIKSGGTSSQFLKADGSVDSNSYITAAQAPSPIPAGTVMLFFQAAAPTGWTKSTTHNNKAIRIVSGSGGVSAGSTGFTTVFTSRTPSGTVSVSGSNTGGSVSSHTLTTAEIPSHTHTINDPGHSHATYATDDGGRNDNTTAQGGQTYLQGGYNTLSATTGISINSSGGGGGHTHGFTNPSWSGSASFTGSSLDFDVSYIDVIVCSKN